MSFLLSWLIVFSGVSIKASADVVPTYTQWSVGDTLSFFGNSFTGNVTVGGVEYTTTFNYINFDSSNNYIDYINIENNDVINSNSLSSYNLLVYKGTVSSLDGSNVRGDIYVPVDIFHSGGLRFFVGAPSNLSNSSTLDSVFVGNAISTNPANMISLSRAPASSSSSDYYNLARTHFRDTSWGGLILQYRLLTYNAEDSSIAFFRFENIASLGRDFFIIIATPYSYDDVSHDSPVTTTQTSGSGAGSVTTVSGGDINVDVNIDLDETNSILEDILDGITSFVTDIIEGVVYIFKPVDDDYIENWLDDMADVISEAFSDKVDIDILRDMLIDLGSYGATTSIEFPSFSIGDYTFPARAVALRPSGFDSLFNLVETAINLVCTIWVFNMVLMRIKAVFVGESVVEVEGDVE